MTSLQTKASSGRVVSMFKPKQKRAILTIVLVVGKLLRTFPCVLEPKVMKPARAIARHAMRETLVLI